MLYCSPVCDLDEQLLERLQHANAEKNHALLVGVNHRICFTTKHKTTDHVLIESFNY